MILTQCAVCATELGLSLGKKCGRCSTRYCGPECQVQHWKEGGHDNLCKKIKKAGGAEQYNANKKYAEAVAVAAEACAEDTKGQTLHLHASPPLENQGGPRARVFVPRDGGLRSRLVLAEQVKILVAEAEENNLEGEDMIKRTNRWHMCSLCEQQHHGVVACALGWACWKTYLGRPEALASGDAMTKLGNGLFEARLHEDAIPVFEAKLSFCSAFAHQ